VHQTQGYKNLDLLHDNLYARARRVLKSDVSDLPPRLISEYVINLSKQHARLYKKLVDERMVEIGEEMIDMVTAQALYQATQQVLLNPEKYGEVIKENTLFEALDEIINELEGRKVLIYAWYNASVDTICERYAHLNPVKINGTVTGDKREQAKQSFINDKECKLLVSNPKSGGVGIDGLQDVCSHVIYAEVCPFIGTFQQSVDRLHRKGQKAESVNVYVLVANNTVAVKLRNDLVKKDSYQESVMKDKRAILADLQGADGIQGSLDDVD
jgi:SNF2 family DNA or RNA helicase